MNKQQQVSENPREQFHRELQLRYQPSSNSHRNPYQQFIPMSQHGQRRINGVIYQNQMRELYNL